MNCGLGVIFAVGGAVFIFIKSDYINVVAGELPGIDIAPLLCISLAYILSMNTVSAPSISLEGKTLWILRSLPVSAKDILKAKINLHLVICLPFSVISSALCTLAVMPTPSMTVLIFVFPAATILFCALFGLIMNLKFPKFDWINETVPVKQGISVLFAMFGPMAILIIPVILYLTVFIKIPAISVDMFMWATLVVLLAVCAALYRYVTVRGAKIFDSFVP